MAKQLQKIDDQAGFTLAELAIALVIVGLLIGGVLKGKELVKNSRIKSTMSVVSSIQKAHHQFGEKYNGLPGDLLNANQKLNYTWRICDGRDGRCDGDKRIEGFVSNESLVYFQHLLAAEMIGGMELSGSPAANYATGLYISPLEGGFIPSSSSQWEGTWLQNVLTPTQRRRGPYDGTLLSQLDIKYDDGRPNSGWIRAASDGTSCFSDDISGFPTDISTYLPDTGNCVAYFRIEK